MINLIIFVLGGHLSAENQTTEGEGEKDVCKHVRQGN
jgi:hypothetical protein